MPSAWWSFCAPASQAILERVNGRGQRPELPSAGIRRKIGACDSQRRLCQLFQSTQAPRHVANLGSAGSLNRCMNHVDFDGMLVCRTTRTCRKYDHYDSVPGGTLVEHELFWIVSLNCVGDALIHARSVQDDVEGRDLGCGGVRTRVDMSIESQIFLRLLLDSAGRRALRRQK